MTSYVQHDGDGDSVENAEVAEAILNDNNELSHIEREITVCDTCGDQGYEYLLVICCNCGVGAEHTYCMMEKIDKVPDSWSCYDCTKEVDEMREEKGNEETSSRKRKADAVTNFFETSEKTSSQRQFDLLNTQSYPKIRNFDLNVDPNIKLGEVSGIDMNKVHDIDLNRDPNIELGEVPGIDINKVHDIDLNVDPNVNMSLGHASSFEVGSSSNFQAQYAKKPRMDT
ncbi:putative chromatin regulator PHD family [Arabidopsis thaliana]|uniref:Zinc finger FYVE/PHD-type n=1 Tax=Arabidopsis thaliana x Arabidopsis arenosa TaxID=1240361 RepID=A0A8T2E2B1_9BRAS|nr:Zinc finger FYVE/PHD-type [Arabidopsis thaliana x Arabidopsis arenosa]